MRATLLVSFVMLAGSACGGAPFGLDALDECPDVEVTPSGLVLVRSVENAVHDIAFRVGCNGRYWIAVLDQGRRTELEKQIGSVSAVELTPDYGPTLMTFSGVVADVPYPEFTYSWGLTEQQQAILDERGAFIRLTRQVTAYR